MYPSVQESHDYSLEGRPAPTAPPPAFAGPPLYVSNSFQRGHALQPGQWTSGLCHCFDDPENCLVTCFCPCLTFGQVTELINKGKKSCMSRGCLFTIMCFMGCACFYSCFYRSKLRAQFDLREEPCNDCLVHFCCTACALCQEYREFKNRGFDMAIGWEANMDRQQRGVSTMAPPKLVTGMTR